MASRTPQVILFAAGTLGAYVLARYDREPQHHRTHHHAVASATTASTAASPSALATSIASTAPSGSHLITVYACKIDGQTLLSRQVNVGAVSDSASIAYLAAVQAIAGPSDIHHVVRFPTGTIARSVRINGSTVEVDLSKAIEQSAEGGFTESGEFKALVWTLTALPGITRVRVFVDGKTVPLLPGGHLELDSPLSRADF